jgi:hypothetical protein
MDTYSVHKKPMLRNCLSIKKEYSTSSRLVQKIRSKSCNPVENRKASPRFEHKKSDGLLNKQSDNDSGPANSAIYKYQYILESDEADQGTCDLLLDDNQIQNWKTKSPVTEIARSP